MKKIIMLVSMFLILIVISGCQDEPTTPPIIFERGNMEFTTISETEVRIGQLYQSFPKGEFERWDDVFMIPAYVNGYTVSSICMGNNDTYDIHKKRVYIPGTIKYKSSIDPFVVVRDFCFSTERMKGGCEFFYCGLWSTLGAFREIRDKSIIYVPNEYYEEYINSVYNPLWGNDNEIPLGQNLYNEGRLKTANVEYHLGYGDYDYYYIDNYIDGELIKYIPFDPVRKGYHFAGWYSDEAYEHKWDFAIDTLNLTERPILKLYAKWEVFENSEF